MMVKLIAHVLVHSGGDYLLIQRSEIKRGQPNVYPTYWDTVSYTHLRAHETS